MTVGAGGYVLIVPPNRRDTLLEGADPTWASNPDGRVVEPVHRFQYAATKPLLVFASFEDGKLTHIADGRKGQSAGTDLAKLNIINLQPLLAPIDFFDLEKSAPLRLRHHVRRLVAGGGLLPPKTLGAFVDVVTALDPSLAARLARYSEQRRMTVARMSREAKQNLAFQKDAVSLALNISGIQRDPVLEWRPAENQRSFLDGLPGAKVREDIMLLADFDRFPGFDALGAATHFGSKTFADKRDPSIRLTILMANRQGLEHQLGADLIYYNETFRSFVLVQYKAMEREDEKHVFRWTTGDQFCDEVARMDALQAVIKGAAPCQLPDSFRLHGDPFFFKFCPRTVFDPDDTGLFSGIYLPIDLWRRASNAGVLTGPRGGNVITYENVTRRLDNSEFSMLVAKAWVGTSAAQSSILADLIREIISSGKTLTLAIKHVGRGTAGREAAVAGTGSFLGDERQS